MRNGVFTTSTIRASRFRAPWENENDANILYISSFHRINCNQVAAANFFYYVYSIFTRSGCYMFKIYEFSVSGGIAQIYRLVYMRTSQPASASIFVNIILHKHWAIWPNLILYMHAYLDGDDGKSNNKKNENYDYHKNTPRWATTET